MFGRPRNSADAWVTCAYTWSPLAEVSVRTTCYFFIIAIFVGIPSKSLCGGERDLSLQSSTPPPPPTQDQGRRRFATTLRGSFPCLTFTLSYKTLVTTLSDERWFVFYLHPPPPPLPPLQTWSTQQDWCENQQRSLQSAPSNNSFHCQEMVDN